MKKIILTITILISLFLHFTSPLNARSGCCSWHGGVSYCDTSVGRYVCNDGTYSPSCGCAYIPPIYYNPTPTFPPITASWKYVPNNPPNKTYTLEVILNDNKPTQYSATLSKCKGCNPGPLTDFYSNKFIFIDVKPGTWYLNVKKMINGVWSTVSYWTINVPQWIEPTVIPTPTPTPILTSNADYNNDSFTGGFVGVGIMLIFIGTVYIFYRLIKWFISYIKEHEKIRSILFWIVLIIIGVLIDLLW